MTDNAAMWCTTCGGRFTEQEAAGASCCPKCKTTGIPCSPEKDYLIEINWHELRILGMWAAMHAQTFDGENTASEESAEGSRKCLRGILSRLERQAPGETALTLGGEVRQLREGLAEKGATVEAINVPAEGLVVVNGPGAVGYSKKPSNE